MIAALDDLKRTIEFGETQQLEALRRYVAQMELLRQSVERMRRRQTVLLALSGVGVGSIIMWVLRLFGVRI